MLRVVNRIMKYQTDVNPWGRNQIYFCWQDLERLYEGYRLVIDPSQPKIEDAIQKLLDEDQGPVDRFLQIVQGLEIPIDNHNDHIQPNTGGPQCLAVITNIKQSLD
jgi:hypothetical protein